MTNPANNIRVVLVGTTHPGNIGATARAMKVMGLERLYLVSPKGFPSGEATARASHADDILANAVVVDDFMQAIAGCPLVLGTSGKSWALPQPAIDPRMAASKTVSEAGQHEVAVVFGREKTGLHVDEIKHCHWLVSIPTSEHYGSLNLAQAVQILAYEIHLAMIGDAPGEVPPSDWDPVEPERLEFFFQRLEKALLAIGFLNPRQPKRLMQRLRRLYLRARPDENEINILNGIVSHTLGIVREQRNERPDEQED
ncbi:MAG: RNA methyltransferase [Xanthomonadales bacterium]|nr:RNA methyltransferase [Xanthomonadales bacterium]